MDAYSTLPEFINRVIQEYVQVSEYRYRLISAAESLNSGCDDNLSLNLLPLITFNLVTTTNKTAIPVTAVWQLIRLAAKLFDDVEDCETGDHFALVNNLATGCLVASHVALNKLQEFGASEEQTRLIKAEFSRACLTSCVGQDVDLLTRWDHLIPSPDEWLDTAKNKSGILFSWASWSGAVLSGANLAIQSGFKEFGIHLGILVQIADDYNGLWGASFDSDLSAMRVTLPISYAFFVANIDEKEELHRLLREAKQGGTDAICKGRNMISNLGGEKFILTAAQVQRQEAFKAIASLPIDPLVIQNLSTLLERTFPVLARLPLSPYETNPKTSTETK